MRSMERYRLARSLPDLKHSIIYIYYNKKDNIFYNIYDSPIYNIFDYITPHDILLFKNDPGYNLFPYRYNDDILVEIFEYIE